jgi:large subunit ribosomal protein L13
MDMGDFVVVINAEKIKVTGQKMDAKMYYKHTNHPGGLKEKTLRQMLEIKPENVITAAVKGMLPKNKLAAQQLKKLKVYAGPEHPHAAQAPKTLDF